MRSAALALVILGFGSAQAADLPSSQGPPIAPIMTVYDWTGFYIGANIGYAWSSTTGSNADLAALRAFYGSVPEPSGVFGGLQAGYNVQFANNLVLGVEVGGGIGSGFSDRAASALNGTNLRVKGEWYAMLSGRIGYAMDRIMPYLAGGVAIASNNARATFPAGGVNVTNTHFGWQIGGGLEVAVTQRFSIAGDFRYFSFDRQTYGGVRTGSNVSTVTARGNYRF